MKAIQIKIIVVLLLHWTFDSVKLAWTRPRLGSHSNVLPDCFHQHWTLIPEKYFYHMLMMLLKLNYIHFHLFSNQTICICLKYRCWYWS